MKDLTVAAFGHFVSGWSDGGFAKLKRERVKVNGMVRRWVWVGV